MFYKENVKAKIWLSSKTRPLVSAVVDPTRSMGRRDSLLNEKKMCFDFRVLENPSPRRNNFSLELPLTFCFYFIKGKTK